MNSHEAISACDDIRSWLVDNQDVFDDAELDLHIDIRIGGATRDDLRTLVRSHGRWDKKYFGDWFKLERSFGRGKSKAWFTSFTARENVCTPVPTGNKVVIQREVRREYEDVEVDEVVWECDPLLAEEAS